MGLLPQPTVGPKVNNQLTCSYQERKATSSHKSEKENRLNHNLNIFIIYIPLCNLIGSSTSRLSHGIIVKYTPCTSLRSGPPPTWKAILQRYTATCVNKQYIRESYMAD